MELLDSKTAHEGFVADVAVKRYRRAGGTEVERQVIEHPGSVAILAGTLDVEGESELECAKRELGEDEEI